MSRISGPADGRAENGAMSEFVTMSIAGQRFGIPVLQVQDVLGPQRIACIPLAPPWVAGALNLRGRIVTAIDVRRRLGLAKSEQPKGEMSIVIEHDAELYNLLVDEVGEVMETGADAIGPTPATLDPAWRQISMGIVQSSDSLLIILDVKKLFGLAQTDALDHSGTPSTGLA
jgi:purine-binding chemotaxis protein CheW